MPRSSFYCEMHCKGTVCTAAHNNQPLVLFFSSVYALCASPSCVIHERLLRVSPPPAILKFLHVCVTLFFSFAQVFHAVAILLYQLSKPEAKNISPMKPAPCLYPSIPFCLSSSTSPFDCLSSQFVALSGRVNGARHVTKQPTRDCTGI